MKKELRKFIFFTFLLTPCIYPYSQELNFEPFFLCEGLERPDEGFCTDIVHEPKKVRIDVWYGLEQSFGHIGNPQRQINVLGNIRNMHDGYKVYYTLNDRELKTCLTIGSDLNRLACEGDFNVDINRSELINGPNQIKIYIENDGKIIASQSIQAHYNSGNIWPLPYYVCWDQTEKFQDVVAIVDGKWEITSHGARIGEKYYDRVLAFGDESWVDYEVASSVVFHGYTPPAKGPPTYNVSHVAIATRWPGHDTDSLQPDRKWFPLGATSEFRITDEYDSCRWRIFDGENFYLEQNARDYRSIRPEKLYRLKHRVESISEIETQYSVKFWDAELPEPGGWDLQAVEVMTRKESGSALLIAHNTDVTFGNISVTPLKGSSGGSDYETGIE